MRKSALMRRTPIQTAAFAAALLLAAAAALYFGLTASANVGNGTITASVNGGSAQAGLNSVSVQQGTAANEIQFVYTAPAFGTTAEFTIAVPSGWTTPQTAGSGSAGYVVLGTCPSGSVAITGGRTIDVTFSTPLPSSNTCALTYGSPDWSVPPNSNVGTQTWTTQASLGGGLANLGVQPQINVLSVDGSGTMQVSPTGSTAAASTGRTYTLTYTAATGGLSDGDLQVTVPSGFSAPSTTSTDNGYTTSNCGSVAASGQIITVSHVSVTGGSSCTIVYGDKGSGGAGVTVGETYGTNTFGSKEESETPGGSGFLTSLASSPSVFVNPASFQVTDSLAGGHASAGSSFDLTVTAKDAAGSTLTSYTGTVDFSTSDTAAGVTLPASYSFTGGDNGTHTFSSGVTLDTAGAQTVTVKDDAYNSITTSDDVTVDALAATRLQITGDTTEPAGTLDALTISALDPYGNVDTTYSGTKSITVNGGAGSNSGTQPYVYDSLGSTHALGAISVTFAAGVASGGVGGASADELKIFLPAAATNVITATDGTISTAGSDRLSVTVTPLTADHFGLAVTESTSTAGSTNYITLYAQDTYGNVDTSYDSGGGGAGCTALTWSGASTSPGGYAPTAGGCDSTGQVAFGETSYSHFNHGIVTVPITLYDWQFANPSVTDGTISGTVSSHIGVDPAATDHLVVAGSGTQTAGQSQDLTITAADLYGNQEPGYTGEHELTFSGADDAPDGTHPTVTDDGGHVVAFSDSPIPATFATGIASAGAGTGAGQLHMKLYDAENADVSVTDGTYSGDLHVAVADAGIDHFKVSGSSSQTAGLSRLITITALDAYDNHATSFDGFDAKEIEVTGASTAPDGSAPFFTGNPGQGSVQIPFGSCSDPSNASGITFSGGVGTTNITLYDAETADIRVEDCQSSAVTPDGSDQTVDVSAASAARFGVTSVPAKASQDGPFSVTTSALDDYGNVTATTEDENYSLALASGSGNLGGTTTGTISSGDSSDTLHGVTYDAQETIHLTATGDLATSSSSAGIAVGSPDGQGTMTASPSHVLPGSTGNTIVFSYNPATTLDTGSVSIVVPDDWPAPSTNPNAPGYTKTGCSSCGHAGDVSVDGQTITVSSIQTNQTIYISYGSTEYGGPGATAPATSGGETWSASSQTESDSGDLEPLAASPAVYVDSPDGSGSLGVSPDPVIAGSTGNDMTLTYTAAAGGLGDGSITIDHPAGWTAFSAGSLDTSDCSGCTVSYPGGNLELDNVTLASAEQLTIDYTATAPAVTGDYSFAAQEASSSGGTLADLAATPQVHVAPAAIAEYGVVASSSQTAGGEQGLSIVALDAYGNLESSGPNDVSGDVSLTFSGAHTAPDGASTPTVTDKNGDAVDFGSPTVVTFTDGEAEGDGTQLDMVLYDAEAASIAVTDGTTSSPGTTVNVSPAGLAGFTVEKSTGGAIGTQRSGVSFTVKTTALDQYDNVQADYAGPVDFSTNDAACDSGCDSDVGGFSGGVLSRSFTLDRSGPGVTVSVADHVDDSKSGTSAAFLLVPNHFVIALSDGATTTAGNNQDLTLTAKDSDGTTAASYRGTVRFTTTDGSPFEALPTDYTFIGADNGVHTFPAEASLAIAGEQTVYATDPDFTALTGSVDQDVLPAAASQVKFTSSNADVVAGATKTLTAEVRDNYGNLVDSSAGVTFSHTAGAGTVTGLGTVTAVHGVATDVVTGTAAGSLTITVSSGALDQDTSAFSVLPGAATHLAFTSSTSDLASGDARTLTAQLEDVDDNVVPAAAHITFAKTGGTGTVSGLGTARAAAGVASRDVTGVLAGSITIQASDGVFSTTTTFSVVPGPVVQLAFSSSTGPLAAGGDRVLTVLLKDAAGNLVTTGSQPVTFTRTGGTGKLAGLGEFASSSGVASDEVTGTVDGTITLKASTTGMSTTTSFRIVSGEAAQLAFTSSTGSLGVGHNRKLTVEVEDAYGNLVKSPAKTVTFAKCSGAGAVSGLPASPDSSAGKASTVVRATGAGRITVCATADGLAGDATSFQINGRARS